MVVGFHGLGPMEKTMEDGMENAGISGIYRHMGMSLKGIRRYGRRYG